MGLIRCAGAPAIDPAWAGRLRPARARYQVAITSRHQLPGGALPWVRLVVPGGTVGPISRAGALAMDQLILPGGALPWG